MRRFPIVMTVTGYRAPRTIGTIRISNIKIIASDTSETRLCVISDNSVNIIISFRFLRDATCNERPKGQIQTNFCWY
jgi:pimeloyl-CoA synthetase